MTAEETARFQRLHRLFVEGKTLPDADKAFYEHTLRQLDVEESEHLKQFRDELTSRIEALEDELSRLQERRFALKAHLESRKTARAA
jgi:DNA gyrase/topoisomerase IV subunit A